MYSYNFFSIRLNVYMRSYVRTYVNRPPKFLRLKLNATQNYNCSKNGDSVLLVALLLVKRAWRWSTRALWLIHMRGARVISKFIIAVERARPEAAEKSEKTRRGETTDGIITMNRTIYIGYRKSRIVDAMSPVYYHTSCMREKYDRKEKCSLNARNPLYHSNESIRSWGYVL